MRTQRGPRGVRSRPVADASALRSSAARERIGRPGTARPIKASSRSNMLVVGHLYPDVAHIII
jgi:hypothetical protein